MSLEENYIEKYKEIWIQTFLFLNLTLKNIKTLGRELSIASRRSRGNNVLLQWNSFVTIYRMHSLMRGVRAKFQKRGAEFCIFLRYVLLIERYLISNKEPIVWSRLKTNVNLKLLHVEVIGTYPLKVWIHEHNINDIYLAPSGFLCIGMLEWRIILVIYFHRKSDTDYWLNYYTSQTSARSP